MAPIDGASPAFHLAASDAQAIVLALLPSARAAIESEGSVTAVVLHFCVDQSGRPGSHLT